MSTDRRVVEALRDIEDARWRLRRDRRHRALLLGLVLLPWAPVIVAAALGAGWDAIVAWLILCGIMLTFAVTLALEHMPDVDMARRGLVRARRAHEDVIMRGTHM